MALSDVRDQLESFAADAFASLPRSDQRVKGAAYIRGALTDGRRKSMQPMAERVGIDYQAIQQFISTSTWRVEPVRERLAQIADEVVDPAAWVIDDTGFIKDGKDSPCVARQYTGTAGKVTNCQVGVSIHMASDTASCPVNWRLFMPESWDDTLADAAQAPDAARRRAKCKIPEGERHHEKWRMALEMIDELLSWSLKPPVIVSDSGYGETTEFRLGLEQRNLDYVAQVKSDITAHAEHTTPSSKPYRGRGRPPKTIYRTKPISLREHALAAGQAAIQTITWRKSSTGDNMQSQFLAIRVRPATRKTPRDTAGEYPTRWLIAEWPDGEPEPIKYWLSNLPATTPITTLVRLAKIRWRIEHDYRELKTGLGLDHFEGRSWLGWHHHVTLISAAHLFVTITRLAPKAPAPAQPSPSTP